MAEEEPRKRSRFDQTEPDRPRPSRFDRRSRSPAPRKTSETIRSRSPVSRDGKSPLDPASAAAAAAARINAQLQVSYKFEGGNAGFIIQTLTILLLGEEGNPACRRPTNSIRKLNNLHWYCPSLTFAQTSTPKQEDANGEIYTQDGDYIRDIEVNDLRNRYTLTKGATQKMVNNHFVMVALILSGHSFLSL